MAGDSPVLCDTSTMGANGAPYSIASEVPTTTTPRYSYVMATTALKPTFTDGWIVSAFSSRKQTVSALTSLSPATTTEVAVFTPSAAPLMRWKPQRMSSPYIAIIVLIVVFVVVAAILMWFTWFRRRKKAGELKGVNGENERRLANATKKALPREPELSWMTGPTLIPERQPCWSTRTLVSPSEGDQQRSLTDQADEGPGRETIPTAPPPIPPRSISRRQGHSTARRRELPLPLAPFTPLKMSTSPMSHARGGRQAIVEDELLSVVHNDSCRSLLVSPLENEASSRGRSAK